MTKVGIIGAGYMADHHLKVLTAIKSVDVTSICSRTIDSASKMSKKWGIERVFKDHVQMIESGEVEAVFICAPVSAMFDITRDVLERGIPCLIEKPVGLSTDEASVLAIIARDNNTKTAVGCNRRFISTIQEAKKAANNLGGLRHLTVVAHEPIEEIASTGQYSDSVMSRWIFANGIHCIDLIRYFVGDVDEVSSMSENQNYAAVLRSGNATVSYTSRSDAKGRWSVTLDCRKGRVTLCPLEKTVIEADNKTNVVGLSEIDQEFKPGLWHQNNSFLKFLESSSFEASDFGLSDIHDNFKTMKVIDKIVS